MNKRFGPFRLVLLLILCLGSFGPTKGAEAPAEHSADFPAAKVFLFIGVYGAGAGGRTEADHFLVVSGTNHAQRCSVLDDTVLTVEEKLVPVDGLLTHVATLASGLPRGFVRRGENLQAADGLIPRYVRISFQLASGQTYDWAGYEKDIPSDLQQIRRRTEALMRNGESVASEKPFAYLGAYWLDEHTASRFKRQGLLHAIALDSSAPGSPLLESLQRPFRLLPVNRDANPFQPFRRTFQPGRDVLGVTFSGKSLQVRSYTTTGQK